MRGCRGGQNGGQNGGRGVPAQDPFSLIGDDWTVLGIVRAKLPNTIGDGIGFGASMRAFENFFREKTGQELK